MTAMPVGDGQITSQSMLDEALAYARRGFAVFPVYWIEQGRCACGNPKCDNPGKHPMSAHGRNDATTDQTQIRRWWNKKPKANIGIATGKESGLYVVDIDPRHSGEETFDDLIGKHGQPPEGPIVLTGGGGRHLYFQFKSGLRGAANSIGQGIDTRGFGGYVLAPPSNHLTGGSYAWEFEAGLELDIPEAPEWLEYRGESTQQMPRLASGNLGEIIEVKEALNLDPKEIGSRNSTLNRLVGKWISQSKSREEIDLLAAGWNTKNKPPMSAEEVARTVESTIHTHERNHPASPVPEATEEEPCQDRAASLIQHPGCVPAHLLNPPGIAGDICRWINDTAPISPQPFLTVGNVLAFLGALFGRKVATETNLRTNLYCVGVADSGGGKDNSRKRITHLCNEAGITTQIMGGSRVTSDSALLATVTEKPSILFQFDEVGHFLSSMTARSAQGHVKAIAPMFTQLFSSADTTFFGCEYANRRDNARRDVVQPNVCFYGLTAPRRLHAGITPDEIEDGFMPRLIVFYSDNPDPEEQSPMLPAAAEEAAKPLVEFIKFWWTRRDLPKTKGNIASDLIPCPIVVRMDGEAKALDKSFGLWTRKHRAAWREEGRGLDVFWTRAREHARKVALVIACGMSVEQTPVITAPMMEWAIQLIDYTTSRLAATLAYSVGSNERERDLLYVQEKIANAGNEGISKSDLLYRTRRISKRIRDELLDELIETSAVEVISGSNLRGSRSTIYRIRS